MADGRGLLLICLGAAALVLASVPAFALPLDRAPAPSPTDQLRAHFDRAFRVLDGATTPSRSGTLIDIADEVVDWNAVVSASLADHWTDLGDRQRSEMIASFRRLFADWFATLLRRPSPNREARIAALSAGIAYLGETVSGDRSVVRTLVAARGGRDLRIDYRMRLGPGGRWRVYDVDLDGTSLVANYRAQFDRMLARHSYDELALRMAPEPPRRTSRRFPPVFASPPEPDLDEAP